MSDDEIKAGRYYGIRHGSDRLEDYTGPPRRPDKVICRRVVDYPGGRPPTRAQVGTCAECDAPIAFNPAGPYQDVPKVCMQCTRVRPLPFPQ